MGLVPPSSANKNERPKGWRKRERSTSNLFECAPLSFSSKNRILDFFHFYSLVPPWDRRAKRGHPPYFFFLPPWDRRAKRDHPPSEKSLILWYAVLHVMPFCTWKTNFVTSKTSRKTAHWIKFRRFLRFPDEKVKNFIRHLESTSNLIVNNRKNQVWKTK